MPTSGSHGSELFGDLFEDKPATRNALSQLPLAVGDCGICLGFQANAKHSQGSLQLTNKKSRSIRARHSWTALWELPRVKFLIGLAEAFSDRAVPQAAAFSTQLILSPVLSQDQTDTMV